MDPLGMKIQPRTISYWWMICIFNWLYLLSLFKCGQLWMGRTLVLVMPLKDTFSKAMLFASLNAPKELDSGGWTVQTKVIPWLLMDGESELGLAAMCKCVGCKLTSWWVGCEPDILRCEDVGYVWEGQGATEVCPGCWCRMRNTSLSLTLISPPCRSSQAVFRSHHVRKTSDGFPSLRCLSKTGTFWMTRNRLPLL